MIAPGRKVPSVNDWHAPIAATAITDVTIGESWTATAALDPKKGTGSEFQASISPPALMQGNPNEA